MPQKNALAHLKITRTPRAFAALAERHNLMVDLIASMKGGPGIQVENSGSNILVATRPTLPWQGSGGGTYTGNVANVVGFDGKVVGVLANAASTGITYPNILRTGNAATNYVQLDPSGLLVQGTTGALTILTANVVRDMSIRTINVCDNGNYRSMDIIASAPY